MPDLTCLAHSSICNFDKNPTLPIILFELFIIVGTVITLFILSKIKKQILLRYLIVAIGVFIFETFTAPMWNNLKMGRWAYLYIDVSWILTIGWSTLVLAVIVVIDKLFQGLREWKRFALYLVLLAFLVYFFESIVVNLGIRTYSPEVMAVVKNHFIPIINLPIEGLYYIPVFMTLVISFYKYWNFMIEKEPIIPLKKSPWLRNLTLSIVGVFLFELMIEPMVTNAKLPSWSYVYRDISFIMTGIWIALIWIAINLINKLFVHFDLRAKFIAYVLTAGAFALPIESWFIQNGYRIYGPSAVANFSGFKMPITGVPIEVAFAIPLYLALIISFIRYWEIVVDNKK
jgi:hypothetical protein